MSYDRRRRFWIGQKVTAGETTTKTVFVYDGSQIVMQFDGTGTDPLPATNLSHRYLTGPAVDQILADEQLSPLTSGSGFDLTTPGSVVWPLTDHLGTVRDLAEYDAGTDTTTVGNHRAYNSFGDLASQSNAAVDCVFGFTGQVFDRATGLCYYRARWYDPRTGGFIGQDPMGFGAGDSNLYRYCGNNSLVHTDPTGERWRIGISGAPEWVPDQPPPLWDLPNPNFPLYWPPPTEVTPPQPLPVSMEPKEPWFRVWIAEFGWHQNINVGNWRGGGTYFSWSFGVDDTWHILIPFRTGSIYDDDHRGGETIKSFRVTRKDVINIRRILRSMEGTRMTYGIPYGNCRTFSNDIYDLLNELYPEGKAEKRCQEPLFGDSLWGRPRGRKADSRSNRFVIRSTHASLPKG